MWYWKIGGDIMLIGWNLAHPIQSFFHGILLWLDSIVYEFVSLLYKIFLDLAEINIFSQEFYEDFSSRIYAIIGVVMLFVLAYALLRALVDPDQLTKGDKGMAKLVPTFITSLVIIGLLPAIFNFAYQTTTFILQENIIGVLIFGESGDSGAIRNFGTQLSYTSLHAFLNPENNNGPFDDGVTWEDIKANIRDKNDYGGITQMADAIADGKVAYRWGFSTAVGLFLIYVLASFCLDLAVRAVRLAFLQLIAPIPVLMRVLPTKNDMFKNWMKKTIACFTEVFVRVLIMYLVVYFVSSVELLQDSGTGFEGLIVKVLIIMGILMFAKEFPGLLKDITGIDSGNIKLGLKDFVGKLGAGGLLGATAVVGAGLTTGIRNTVNGWRNGKIGIGSGIAGAFSASARAAKGGFTAKNFSDMNKATTSAITSATEAREKRAIYKSAHGGTVRGVLKGHAVDTWDSMKTFVGAAPNVDALKRQASILQDISNKRKEMSDKAEAEILKPGKINKFRVSAAHQQHVNGKSYDNLAVLDNLIEMVKNKGSYVDDATGNPVVDSDKVARYISELQNARNNLKDQMVIDYLNGDKLDGLGTHDVSNIAGPVRDAITSFNTTLKNNIGAVVSNLKEEDLADASLQNWKSTVDSYLAATKNMDITEIIDQSDRLNLGQVADDAKKYVGRASSNVNTQVNNFMQKEANKDGKK